MVGRIAALVLIFASILGTTSPVLAHKVVLVVYVTGSLVEGEVGFSNGDIAAGAIVEVFGPNGEQLHRLQTDSDGFFEFDAKSRVDHIVKVDLGAGHVAEARVAAAELPTSLGGEVAVATNAENSPATAAAPASSADLEAMIQAAVASQIRPLRQQLAQYENKVRWNDVLGGIGYILGLTGIAAYLQSRRQNRSASVDQTEGSRS